jgi:predicted DNA-binding transcriptional regulator AlpA
MSRLTDRLGEVEPPAATPDASKGKVLLDAKEAAAKMGITQKALYAAASKGTIPGARRIGRKLTFHAPTLLGWMAGRAPSSGRH